MPFRKHAGWITPQANNVRLGCDVYQKKFPSVYGGGKAYVQVDNGPVDLSQEYEGNDAYNITPQDAWGLYDYTDDFHQFSYSINPDRLYFGRN